MGTRRALGTPAHIHVHAYTYTGRHTHRLTLPDTHAHTHTRTRRQAHTLTHVLARSRTRTCELMMQDGGRTHRTHSWRSISAVPSNKIHSTRSVSATANVNVLQSLSTDVHARGRQQGHHHIRRSIKYLLVCMFAGLHKPRHQPLDRSESARQTIS